IVRRQHMHSYRTRPRIAKILVACAVAAAATLALGPQAQALGPGASAKGGHYGLKPLSPAAAPHAAASANTLSLQTSATPGAVSPTPKVYLVFWGSQWSTKDPA